MATEPRPLRADAERNRRRVLDAARKVFAERGLGVGVDVVAREAGVGVGTLYRRFPTKEQLLQAVVDDRIAELREGVHAAAGDREDPWEAFAAAAEALAGAIARDRGFLQALQEAVGVLLPPGVVRDATLESIAPYLERAQKAGAVRSDIEPYDVLALCKVAAQLPPWRLEQEPGLWRRYVAIVLDGLRAGAATELPHPPTRAEVPAPRRPGRKSA